MNSRLNNYWLTRKPLSRRRFVQSTAVGATGLVSAGLIGCGDDDNDDEDTLREPTEATEDGAIVRGGTVLARQPGNFSGLEPVQGVGGGDYTFMWAVFDNLISYDRDLVPQPERSLAEAWETPDEESFVFQLRPGVTFHDETEFNSDAVRRNWEWGLNEDIRSNVRTFLAPILDVETSDDLIARYRLNGGYAPLEKMWGDRPGMMISPASMDRFGPDIINNPVGTGALRFDSYVLDSHAIAHRNGDYWRPDFPYVDEIRWEIVPDEDVAVSALDSGDLNLFWSFPQRLFGDWEQRSSFNTFTREGIRVGMIYLNSVRPPLDNVHARRALAYAIDRQTIIDTIYGGIPAPATSFMGPGYPEFDPDATGIQYDLDSARAELEAGGLADGFEFSMNVSNQPQVVRLAQVFKEQFAQVGITVDLRLMPTPDFYLKFIEEQDGDSFIAGYTGSPDPWQMQDFLFGGEGVYGAAGTQVPDEFVDSRLDKARVTYDFDERRALYREIDEYVLVEQAYDIAIEFTPTLVVASRDLEVDVFSDGLAHLGHGDIRFIQAR